jgi:hypothetical protein
MNAGQSGPTGADGEDDANGAFQGKNHRDEVTALVFYALLAGIMATTWLLVFHYLATNERLLARRTPPSFFAAERQRALWGSSPTSSPPCSRSGCRSAAC